MATIIVDGKEYQVDGSKNLLEVCLELGLNLPYFCWHPALDSVGACRQCAVIQYRDEDDEQGALVMACMTPAADGTRISLQAPEAVEFRASVIEYLMQNHPHDCPICDEGGECHLQDMTVMTGHTYRDFRFRKRTYNNQYLGPLINHEMNRCIQCYRCVRFYQDYAGGDDLDVFGAHDHVYFGRQADGVLESPFSGNLVEVCPTGVFTDKTLKQHYTRKWDLQTAPSLCVHCGLGCNTIPGERYGEIRRVRNRYNREVNGYFLCDRGRYGYQFINHPHRLRVPMLREKGSADFQPSTRDEALEAAATLLTDRGRVIGIGSPRASLEANYALRVMVGEENFHAGVGDQEWDLFQLMLEILKSNSQPPASLHDIERSDAVVVLGEDLTNSAPMMALAVRQAVKNTPREIPRKLGIPDWHDAAVRDVVQSELGPLYIASPEVTDLDNAARETMRAAPEDIARIGFLIAHQIDGGAPAPEGMEQEDQGLAERIAKDLLEAERPMVITGASLQTPALLEAAANILTALQRQGKEAGITFTVPETNSMGLAMMGARSLDELLNRLQEGSGYALVILENDLGIRLTSNQLQHLFQGVETTIALDSLVNSTTSRANILLPAGTYAESDGSLVNNELRGQRFLQVFPAQEGIQESWRWVRDLMEAAQWGGAPGWVNLDALLTDLVGELPQFAPLQEIAYSADFRIAGQKIPRMPHRYTGRTATTANIDVHEPKPPEDPDTPLAFSMEGYRGRPPAALIPRYWAPGWNSVQALNKFQAEVGGELVGGDPGRSLFQPDPEAGAEFFNSIPDAFKPEPERLLILPRQHVFGTEELSALSAPVAVLAPDPYLSLGEGSMQTYEVEEGDRVNLEVEGTRFSLLVKASPGAPLGTAGVPHGLRGMPRWSLPAWGRIEKAGQSESEVD